MDADIQRAQEFLKVGWPNSVLGRLQLTSKFLEMSWCMGE